MDIDDPAFKIAALKAENQTLLKKLAALKKLSLPPPPPPPPASVPPSVPSSTGLTPSTRPPPPMEPPSLTGSPLPMGPQPGASQTRIRRK